MWAKIGTWILQRVVLSGLSWLAQELPAWVKHISSLVMEYFRKKDRAVAQKEQIEETKKVLASSEDPEKRADAIVSAINSGRDK